MKNHESGSKKGLSPVIATLLLVAIVVILALIIFLWLKSFVPEVVEKNGEDISLVCERVQFTPVYESGRLEISNDGNIPIQNMKVKVIDEDGSSIEKDLATENAGTWGEFGLGKTRVFSDDVNWIDDTTKQIVLTPVLRGTTETGYQDKACDERQYGHELDV